MESRINLRSVCVVKREGENDNGKAREVILHESSVRCKKGVLTLQSLKKNANVLGMEEMSDDHFRVMIEATDLNDDKFIDQNEFVILCLHSVL
ncbi:hypothetical protein SUGI_0459900 [Cryptomeria japonica]|nr:hypothetical protein SUGI_0459900 [Cryptomeria japonica]